MTAIITLSMVMSLVPVEAFSEGVSEMRDASPETEEAAQTGQIADEDGAASDGRENSADGGGGGLPTKPAGDESESGPESSAQSGPESSAGSNTESESSAGSSAQSSAQSEPDSSAQSDAQSESSTESNTEPNAEPEDAPAQSLPAFE